MTIPDHELEFLLSLHGEEFRFTAGYRVKIEAQRVKATKGRPGGIKYSLTLHAPDGRRLCGLDNAHSVRKQRTYDHRHVYGKRKVVPYAWHGPAGLLEDFYREVDRILKEQGIT